MQRPTASGGPVRITTSCNTPPAGTRFLQVGAVHAGAFDRRRMLKLGELPVAAPKSLLPSIPACAMGIFS